MTPEQLAAWKRIANDDRDDAPPVVKMVRTDLAQLIGVIEELMQRPTEQGQEVSRAFYDLTVKQRNQAWSEVETLKSYIYTLEQALDQRGQQETPPT